jgi:tRNA (Thr-GGU) A37 N-methylase
MKRSTMILIISHTVHRMDIRNPWSMRSIAILESDSHIILVYPFDQARLRLGMMANNSALRLKVKSQKSEKP